MLRSLALGASMVLILCFTSSTATFNAVTPVQAQASSSQAPQAGEKPHANMQGMMKMHEQMMAEMKAADGRLDSLVKEMNAASGEARVNAVAAVVTELVRQQKAMHEHMGQMHEHMMGSGGMMMKK